VWAVDFPHTPAPGGTKFLILHFRNVSLPPGNRLEVDLGYGTDVFTSADSPEFWTRPVNIYVLPGGLVPIRYITSGTPTGGVDLDRYGRGESHAGEEGHPSISNCDPFLKDVTYTEPTYDPFWYCANPPNWENVARVTDPTDVRARVAPSVGMIVSVGPSSHTRIEQVSTCSVTLVGADTVLTAGHCHMPADALNSSVTFDYRLDAAGNRPAGYNARFYKVKEVVNHRYAKGFDYSLLRLAEAPVGIPVVQMRHDIPAINEEIFGVHHPNGAPKKLSVPHPAFDKVTSSGTMFINVPDNFAVSGGSSGSGLFDRAGRIVGVLADGNPCPTPPDVPQEPLRYFPTSTVLTDITPTPPPPLTRDVVVVLDRSGSMSAGDGAGRTKIDAARDATSLFVQLVRAGTGNRVGLVSFSTAASAPPDFPIAPVTVPNKAALIGDAPFSGGKVGAITPGGSTSIGSGLDAARTQFPVPGANPRALLLLTDGLQNTPPWVSGVQGALSGIDIHAIGLGTEANLDGALLSGLTGAHNGQYIRAGNGLELEKFFSHAFGNIFEAGVLFDPERELPADQRTSDPEPFTVCGEDVVTIVVGWDRTDATLGIALTTPAGATVTGGTAAVEGSSGRTWSFIRVPLPHAAERDGTWSVMVFRPGDVEFPPPAPRLRYFVNIIAAGGAHLSRLPDTRRYYTGDSINPMVELRYGDGSWPRGASVELAVTKPNASIGTVLATAGLRPAQTVDGDTVPARQATLTALEEGSGPVVGYDEQTFPLSEDADATGGRMEAGGVFGTQLNSLLTAEGNYTLRYRATYGDCAATRELFSSLHVDIGIDPAHSDVRTQLTPTGPGGSRVGTVTIVPNDRYGNKLGPGRSDGVNITGSGGTTLTGSVVDNGDGSYTAPVTVAPGATPGVVVDQPGRPPQVLTGQPTPPPDCRRWKRLVWLLLAIVLLLVTILLITWLA